MSINKWGRRALTVIAVWGTWALVTTFLVQPFRIPSPSMAKTLGVGDRIIVNKMRSGEAKRGEPIVFADPNHWTGTPHGIRADFGKVLGFLHLAADGNHLAKRVIGVSGDHVACSASGKLQVNGVTVNEPYLPQGTTSCMGGCAMQVFSIVVPKDDVWVMGDNRGDSADSRCHDDGTGKTGSVPMKNITGSISTVVWPVSGWGRKLDGTEAFAKVPSIKS